MLGDISEDLDARGAELHALQRKRHAESAEGEVPPRLVVFASRRQQSGGIDVQGIQLSVLGHTLKKGESVAGLDELEKELRGHRDAMLEEEKDDSFRLGPPEPSDHLMHNDRGRLPAGLEPSRDDGMLENWDIIRIALDQLKRKALFDQKSKRLGGGRGAAQEGGDVEGRPVLRGCQ